MTRRKLVFALWCGVSVSSCLGRAARQESPVLPQVRAAYDLVLVGTPLQVKRITPGSVADAVESIPENLQALKAIVSFRIDRIESGSLPALRIESPSRWRSLGQVLREGKLHRILFPETDDKKIAIDRQRFKLAVQSPLNTFGIQSWDHPEPLPYRLFLDRHQDDPGTFVMKKAEKLDAISGTGR